MGKNDKKYLIGSWIPTIALIDFDTMDSLINITHIFESLSIKAIIEQNTKNEVSAITLKWCANDSLSLIHI